MSTSLSSAIIVKGSINVHCGRANRAWEKVIGVFSYFIGYNHAPAVVLTNMNYSEHVLLSPGVVDDNNGSVQG
eukprot:UN12231